MDFLLEPNIAYLILMAGIVLGFLAIITPGTGIFEIGAGFCILLAGYAVYNLSFNGWALFLLAVSTVPFIYSIQRPKRELYLGLSILLLVIGSVFIFPSKERLFAVNPFIAILASALVAGFMWISIRKAMEAGSVRPTHDLNGLMGQIGKTRTSVHEEGSVMVGGELWSARSATPITSGSTVRVISRDGFVVVVEKVDTSSS